MNSIVLNTANAATNYPNELSLNLRTDLTLQDQTIALGHLSIYYTWKNFKAEYGNTTFGYTHIPSATNVQVTVPDGSYSIRDINHFIHHTMTQRKHVNADGTFGINLYANAVYNRVTVTVSADYSLNLKPGIRQTLGFTQSLLTNGDFLGDLVPKVERVDTVLVHCNLVNNNYTPDSTILYAFVPNNSFSNLLEIKPSFPIFTYTRNATFKDVKVWLTDQDNQPLDCEDNILVQLLIKSN